MSALFNQTNIAPGTAFSGGGGGGSYPSVVNFSSIGMASPTVGGGEIIFYKDPNPSNPTGTYLAPQYWPGQSSYNLTTTYTQLGNAFCDMIGAQGMRMTSATFNTQPFGEIIGSNDGVYIQGKDASGNVTQVWMEARNGYNKLNCVSTITDSAKTSTINVNALVSTLASAYPGCLSPYA